MSRTPIVVGNWKLNKTQSEALDLVTDLKNRVASIRGVDVGVAPVSLSLAAVAKRTAESSIQVYGQDCHFAENGAFTGAISSTLLADAGATGVIVGHSERRHVFGDSDGDVGNKTTAVLAAGLQVIVCVGEIESERDAGTTEARVSAQLDGALASVGAADVDRLVVAYEPVWAIGTGRTATPAQAQAVHAHIRSELGNRFGNEAAQSIRIQYGGSVKPANAAALMAEPDIDGALVGGASLNAESFAEIVKAARG